MDNLTQNQTPKFKAIKTAASLFKRNRQARAKTNVVTQIFPSKIELISKESKRNSIIHLSKCAKKLDGEEMRTILLNGNKSIPSNHMPNASKIYVHTCLLEEVWVKGFGVTKVSTLEDGVGLPLTVVSQVKVGCAVVVYHHVLGLRFGLHFGLFFLFFFIVYHARAWRRFGVVVRA
jgi:hypothetical protein